MQRVPGLGRNGMHLMLGISFSLFALRSLIRQTRYAAMPQHAPKTQHYRLVKWQGGGRLQKHNDNTLVSHKQPRNIFFFSRTFLRLRR